MEISDWNRIVFSFDIIEKKALSISIVFWEGQLSLHPSLKNNQVNKFSMGRQVLVFSFNFKKPVKNFSQPATVESFEWPENTH